MFYRFIRKSLSLLSILSAELQGMFPSHFCSHDPNIRDEVFMLFDTDLTLIQTLTPVIITKYK